MKIRTNHAYSPDGIVKYISANDKSINPEAAQFLEEGSVLEKENQRVIDVPKDLIHSPLISEIGLEFYELNTQPNPLVKDTVVEITINLKRKTENIIRVHFNLNGFETFKEFIDLHKLKSTLFSDMYDIGQRDRLDGWIAELEDFIRTKGSLEKK